MMTLPTLPTLKNSMKTILGLKNHQPKYLFQFCTNFNNFSIFQFCSLGRLSHEVGWKYQDVVETLEAKRKVKAEAFHKKKMADEKIATAVKKDAKLVKRIAKYQKVIEGYGYA